MKVRQFNRFKREFLGWQSALNLNEYTVNFKLKKYTDKFAEIDADADGCVATVFVSDAKDWTDKQIDTVAKHECIHLLLTRLTELGSKRFVDEGAIDSENERVTCVLEKIL